MRDARAWSVAILIVMGLLFMECAFVGYTTCRPAGGCG